MSKAKEKAKKKLLHCFNYMSGFTLENSDSNIKADIEAVIDLVIEAAIKEFADELYKRKIIMEAITDEL